jgi:hypothetical protein
VEPVTTANPEAAATPGSTHADDVDTYATTPATTRSAPILAALENAWGAIRRRHPELPEVVMVLASGSDGAPSGWLKLGHFAAMRWETGGEALMPEVFVGGEGLVRGPVDVLGTLLHEAGHALAHARNVKDTSRQGRYHNQRYAEIARQLGLDAKQAGTIGWSDTSVTDETAAEYAATIAELERALTIYRRSESALIVTPGDGDDEPTGGGDAIRGPRRPKDPKGGRPNGNGLVCRCDCGRRIRVAPTILEAGPITCGVCKAAFQPA